MDINKVFKESYFQSYYSKDKVLQNLYFSQFKNEIKNMIDNNELCEKLLLEINVKIRNKMYDKIMEYKLSTVNKIMLHEMIDEIIYFAEK